MSKAIACGILYLLHLLLGHAISCFCFLKTFFADMLLFGLSNEPIHQVFHQHFSWDRSLKFVIQGQRNYTQKLVPHQI